jgi:cellobiose phosphorylase
MAKFQTAYGSFSDDGSEYHIHRPDPPMPWVNIVTNGSYGLVVSQAGSGYSWLTHASLNRINRWEQDMVSDDWGKYVYIADADSGEVWSPARQPSGENLQNYRVRHGMGYSVIEARLGSMFSEMTYTVAMNDPCELWILRLTNRGDTERKLNLYSYLEWNLGAAPDWHREFHRIFIDVQFHKEHNALLAKKVLWDIPGTPPHWNRSWPYVAFHSASIEASGFDGDKKSFVGRNGRTSLPQAVRSGKMAGNQGRWVDAIASLGVEVRIPAGESRDIVFILGAAEEEEQAYEIISRYQTPEAAWSAFAETRKFWQRLSGDFELETPDEGFNLLGNRWLPYQTVAARLWGRTAYYQTGGAYGFRDQLQDSLIWLLLGRPEKTLEQITLHAAHQYEEGTVLHWWHPLAESGLRSGYSDDLMWLPFVTLYYLYETADWGCLQQKIPFFDTGSATLLEHCLRSFRVALQRRSSRGLPLILEADWNDGMNAVGRLGKGESVWMAHFLYYLLTQWAALPVLDEDTRRLFTREADAIQAAANQHAWDGAWYWRATTDEGKLVGSAQSNEGQIFLNAQTWAVLSGLAPEERASKAMQSARDRLYKPYGALLLEPAYTIPDGTIGYLTRYAPGLRENGGVYFHAACWAILAERKMNGVEAAYDLWARMSPIARGQDPDSYQAEPYVTPGNVDGPLSPYPGRAGWTWYTGSGQWFLRAMVEGVLGVEATLEGLKVSTALPRDWPAMRLHRPFRGAVYEINVRRAGPDEKAGIRVGGKPCAGEILPLAEPGTRVSVEIIAE